MEIAISKAPLTVVRLEDGRRVNVHQGRPVPSSADQDDVERLLEEGYLEVIEVQTDEDDVDDEPDDEPAEVPEVPEEPEDPEEAEEDPDAEPMTDEELATYRGYLEGTIPAILEGVGQNAGLARDLLALETADDGRNRKGLVDGLTEVIAAAEVGS